MAYQTNSFTIAHYILLFFVAVLCIGLVAWTMINAKSQPAAAPHHADAVILAD